MYHKGGDGKPRGFGFSGFSFVPASGSSGTTTNAMPPPSNISKNIVPRRTGPETQLAQVGYGVTNRSYGSSNIGKRRIRSEEE